MMRKVCSSRPDCAFAVRMNVAAGLECCCAREASQYAPPIAHALHTAQKKTQPRRQRRDGAGLGTETVGGGSKTAGRTWGLRIRSGIAKWTLNSQHNLFEEPSSKGGGDLGGARHIRPRFKVCWKGREEYRVSPVTRRSESRKDCKRFL